MINLNLSTGNYELELNFGRIQTAERKLRCSVWPPGADQAAISPKEPVYRIFAAAASLTLDEAYAAVRSDQDFALLDEAVMDVLREYQPEVMGALETMAGAKSLTPAPPTSGKSDSPTPPSTSDSHEPTSADAPSANGSTSTALGRRGKPRERAVLRD